jgi:hypothetical protein
MKKSKCPCCGFYTIDGVVPGSNDICPVCFWEDDGVQFDDPDYEGGANDISLNTARENYSKLGAMDEVCIKHVRRPLPEERLMN